MNRSDKMRMLGNAKDRLAEAWRAVRLFGEAYDKATGYLRSGEDAEIEDKEVDDARKGILTLQRKARESYEKIAEQVDALEKELGVYDDSLDFLKNA